MMSVAVVFCTYAKLKGDSKAKTLAIKLAQEAMFGDDILLLSFTYL